MVSNGQNTIINTLTFLTTTWIRWIFVGIPPNLPKQYPVIIKSIHHKRNANMPNKIPHTTDNCRLALRWSTDAKEKIQRTLCWALWVHPLLLSLVTIDSWLSKLKYWLSRPALIVEKEANRWEFSYTAMWNETKYDHEINPNTNAEEVTPWIIKIRSWYIDKAYYNDARSTGQILTGVPIEFESCVLVSCFLRDSLKSRDS